MALIGLLTKFLSFQLISILKYPRPIANSRKSRKALILWVICAIATLQNLNVILKGENLDRQLTEINFFRER